VAGSIWYCCAGNKLHTIKPTVGDYKQKMWRSAMRATQTAWNSLSHLEEATLHPGLFKRLRAVVVVCVAIAVMEMDL